MKSSVKEISTKGKINFLIKIFLRVKECKVGKNLHRIEILFYFKKIKHEKYKVG
jgi:hypothetical protein